MSDQAQNTSEELARLWTKAQPKVAGYIATSVPHLQDREDLLQRVAVVLVRKFDQYDHRVPFVAFAIGIARYEILRHRRSHAASKLVFDDVVLDELTATYTRMLPALDERQQAIAQCVATIQGRSRQVLEWRYGADRKTEEIAGKLGLTDGAVRVILHRVRTAIRNCVIKRLAAGSTRDSVHTELLA